MPDRTAETLSLLVNAGNDERKLAIVLALDGAGEALTKTALYTALNERAGEILPGNRTGPMQFCGVLQKTGGVEVVPTSTGPGVRLTDYGREVLVPFAGALLGASEDADFSLRVLGKAGSTTRELVPLARFGMLRNLTMMPDESPAISRLADGIGLCPSTALHTAMRLQELGIVTVESAVVRNTRTVRILQASSFGGEARRRQRVTQTTKKLEEVLAKAMAQKDIWEKDELIEYAATIYPQDTLAEQRALHHRLTKALSPNDGRFATVIEDVSGSLFGDHRTTKVTLRPDVASSIAGVVSVIDGFCQSDARVMESGRDMAGQLLSSPERLAGLYLKAWNSSNQANIDPGFYAHVLRIVRTLGTTATAASVRNQYHEESGRNVSRKTISRVLDHLVEQKELQVGSSYVAFKGHQRRTYGMPAASSGAGDK